MKKSYTRILLCVMLVASIAASMIACGAAPAETTAPDVTTAPAAQGLSFEVTEFHFDQLGQAEAIASNVPGVTYTSEDESIAKVVGSTVIAMGNGTTTITASNGTEEATLMVTVAAEATVVIDGEDLVSLNTESGATAELTASVKVPSIFDNPEAGVIWTSSNPEVATVDAQGVVTAVATGVAQITASSDYQITSTSTQTVMGQTVTETEETIASDVVTVMVNNEFDPAVHADLLGVYEGHYDWQGFAEKASEENPSYTSDNFQWIRSKVVVELKEDGTFTQKVLNAQRAEYPAEIDASLPETTFEEQVAKYGKSSCYVYNAFDQDPAAEEFASEEGKTFAAVNGMESKGMHNFSENGFFMVKDGTLVLYYGHVNGFTGEFESAEFVWGPIADGAYQANPYVPFTNLVPMNENMTMVLERAE